MSNPTSTLLSIPKPSLEEKLERLANRFDRAAALLRKLAREQATTLELLQAPGDDASRVGQVADHYANWTIGGQNWLD